MKEDIKEDLLIRYILNEADTNERREVEIWLQVDDSHKKHFEQTRFLLDSSKQLAQQSPLNEQEAWERFKVKKANSKPTEVKTIVPWLRVAAAVLFIAAGSWAAWYYTRTPANQWTTLNAYEKVMTDTLPDGSVIQLNKHARISYNGRTVKLRGEAFFKVVHDAGKSFTIHAQDVNITDIGTAFNVKSDAGKVEVIVESGIVRVSTKSGSAILKQKQTVIIGPESTSLQAQNEADILYQYYRTGEFVTDHTSLDRLVKMLNEAYNANIQIEGNNLADIPITGTYKMESLDKVLQVIMLTTPEIRRINKGDKIILTR